MFYWDPNPDAIIIPVLHWPIKWYSFLFALGFILGVPVLQGILTRYFRSSPYFKDKTPHSLKLQSSKITDHIIVYMVIATVIGARVGHFIFYEKPSEYLRDPLDIFRIWNGGLASHGAAIAIIISIYLFSRVAQKTDPGLNWMRLLDFVSVPTALAGALIRIGNFMNQEILGTETSLPWGVIFGHPVDGSSLAPRHPVQLYEAFFYLTVFVILWRLTYRSYFLKHPGKLIGLFFVLVFGFRFVIEFFKLEQSRFMGNAHELTMGQWLSIPLILIGVILFFQHRFVKK